MSDQHQPHGIGASGPLQLTSPRAAAGADRDEIHRFKRDIDLRGFAIDRGYSFDERESTPKWTVLRNAASDDKVVVGKSADGHWCYFNHSDAADRGSIVDFVRRRGAGSWAEVYKELREWTGTRREPFVPTATSPSRTAHDRSSVERRLASAIEPPTHPYLEARGLSAETLSAPRFRGTWKQGSGPRREVLFLHRDERGLSGAEVKSPGFTGFTPGGTKGLWLSNTRPTDSRLVVTESGVDALSYHQVNPHPRTRYASCAGQPTAKQLGGRSDGKPGLLAAAISFMPAGSTVVAATDNDKAGHHFAARIAELSAKYPHVTFERHLPTLGKDWNDHLQALTPRAIAPIKRRGLER